MPSPPSRTAALAGRATARAVGARTLAAAVAAALLAGLATAWLTRPAQSEESAGSERVTSATAPPGASGATGPPAARPATVPVARTDRQAAVPQRLAVSRLGIDMAIVPEGVARDGAMALPATPADVGWYRYGPRPGDRAGATVLAAHLDMPGYGIGPIAKVEEVRVGDVVTVRSAATTHRYRVTGVTSIRKTSLDLPALFARDGPPRLHVVTCGGQFDSERRRYDENVVVTAEPTA
ncbi:MAG: class F sortase [Terrabacter sp.]